MDLKEFITETISSIAHASAELQSELAKLGVIVNPPVDGAGGMVFRSDSSSHIFRRVQMVEFDVAVTAASETSAGGRGGLKVFSVEIGAEGNHLRQSEQISRVKFAIPLTLSPSSAEDDTNAAKHRQDEAMDSTFSKSIKRGGSWAGR